LAQAILAQAEVRLPSIAFDCEACELAARAGAATWA